VAELAARQRRRRPLALADPEALVASARAGDARALARLVSLVENRSPELRAVMKAIAPFTGNGRGCSG
jgi:LAO/AO transport system kinase